MYAIETNNLTKYYGKARGVIDLDLKVDEGDIFGFIGPNGSGKSNISDSIRWVLRRAKYEIFKRNKIFGYHICRNTK